MTARNPTTFIVGAGPVATALAGALRFGGVPVLGLWARKPVSARASGSIAGVAAFSSAPPDVLLEAEVIILAVRDPSINEVAKMLLGTGLIGKRHVLLHCAGATSAKELLGDVASQVAGIGTMHPLSAIADGKTAMRSLKGVVFGVEGDDVGRHAAIRLVGCLGGIVMSLEGSQMASYHAAAALASNYIVAALDAAADALAMAGVPANQAALALVPLAEGALRNVSAHGTTDGLTGPVRRGDAQTVRRHLEALQGRSDLVEIYRALARRAVEIASRLDGREAPDRAHLDEIRALLK